MKKIQTFTPHKTSFGTTERRSNINLGKRGLDVANCNYLFRESETPPQDIVDFLIKQAKTKEKTEMKIWGCSDLSSYISKMFAMRQKIDSQTQDRLFGDIELIDIDKDIIERNKKRLIGFTKADFEDLSYEFDINPLKEFEKVESENFFLKGEPTEMYTASKVDFQNYGENALRHQKIIPYRFKEDLLRNTKLRTGDIRKDIRNLAPVDKNTLRIFEFANGWYFMPEKDQVQLACNFAEKMQKNDVLIIGGVELSFNLDIVLKKLGFKNAETMKEVFVKNENLMPKVLKQIKKLLLSNLKIIS
ncbi:MAG: hypothetical protein KHX03_03195 [Clostridium sp.]|nr:hypothetical protein [Clostridium sp.]